MRRWEAKEGVVRVRFGDQWDWVWWGVWEVDLGMKGAWGLGDAGCLGGGLEGMGSPLPHPVGVGVEDDGGTTAPQLGPPRRLAKDHIAI